MVIVSVHAAETRLAELIERACAGEEIVIARGTEQVVKLIPVRQTEAEREFGALTGKLAVPDELFARLSADELEAWEQ